MDRGHCHRHYSIQPASHGKEIEDRNHLHAQLKTPQRLNQRSGRETGTGTVFGIDGRTGYRA